MLQFHRQIIRDIYPSGHCELSDRDGLVILAQGLGLHRLVASVIETHCDRRNLVLLLNTPKQEFDTLRERVKSDLLVNVTNETISKNRSALYLGGGILAVTTRILVVDMLNNVIPIHLISGIIINNAHDSESSMIAFILRLYRKENKEGFIKAFSEKPVLLSHQLERCLKSLMVRQVHCWPRFHVDVMQDIQRGSVELVELRIVQTPPMQEIQQGLLECMSATLNELKRRHTLDADSVKLENSFFSGFEAIIRSQLEHLPDVSMQTRQAIRDITTLRHLLTYLVGYDCVGFYLFLETILAANSETHSVFKSDLTSAWLLSDAAQVVFTQARSRVYKHDKAKKIVPVLEEQPKFKVLAETIQEIQQSRTQGNILILCQGDRVCRQIQQITDGLQQSTGFSSYGAEQLLKAQFAKYRAWKGMINIEAIGSLKKDQRVLSKRRRTKRTQEESVVDLENTLEIDDGEDFHELALQSEKLPYIHVSTFSRADEDMECLEEISPKWIILYSPDMGFVRKIEVFSALHPEHAIKVYFMVYDNSIEEQMYLMEIRKEKEAFERIIMKKSVS